MTAFLAMSFVLAGPCAASSPTPCNRDRVELKTAPNACCCGANCECEEGCGSGDSEKSPPVDSNSSKDSVRDLAKVVNATDRFVSGSWSPAQPEFATRSNLCELVTSAPTLLRQHTCLQV